jgi:hypothetical protein
MTIAATVLRLAVIEALAPHAELASDDPQWPTLAGAQIADSGLYITDRTSVDRAEVAISVSIDEIRGLERAESYGLARQDLDVVLICDAEIGVIDGSEADAVGASPAEAAAKLEATIAQIRYALTLGATGVIFRRLAKAMPSFHARASREPGSAVPLMRLTLSATVTIDDDDWTDVVDGLPAPAHGVRDLFAADGYAAAVLAALAALWRAPADPTPLEIIHLGFAGFGAGAAPATLAAADVHAAADTTE